MSEPEPYAIRTLDLTPEAFAPFGQVIVPLRSLGQFIVPPHNHGTNEASLTLDGGVPRLWIMHLQATGLRFADMARHNRVTQCLGALRGTAWMFAVAAPGTAPALADITGFRIPGDRIVKLHIGTWHSGPHFDALDAMFLNLENMNTRREDFEEAHLPSPCRYEMEPGS